MSKKAKTSDWSRKPSHKGQKCMRGVPLMHDEVKQKVTLCLTPTALARLLELSNEQECSRSEVIEQWLRGSLSLS